MLKRKTPFSCGGSSAATCRHSDGRLAITAVLALALSLLAGSLALFPFLGGEFIPILNEGSVTPQTIRLPGISLEKIHRDREGNAASGTEFPEARMVVSKIGRTELGNDPQGRMRAIPSCRSSRWINGKPPRPNRNLMTQSAAACNRFPGANFLISQPDSTTGR